MKLSELTETLNISTLAGQRWLVLGPEADAFARMLRPAAAETARDPLPESMDGIPLDGLLLAGALSDAPGSETWLRPLLAALEEETILVIVDWQADGPLHHGPDLGLRFKRGKLIRLLREAGLNRIQTVVDRPMYYVIQAKKEQIATTTAHADTFVRVACLAELPKNRMKRVEVFGQQVVVANTGREIVAFTAACPHANQPLDQGKLRGRKIVCPRHGYIWNVCTGEPIEPVDEDILPRYQVKVNVEQEEVWVALTPAPGE